MAKNDKARYDEAKARKKAMEDNDFLVSQADLLNRKLEDQVKNAKELNKLRGNLLKGMIDEKDNLDQQKALLEEYDRKLRDLVDRRTKHGKNLLEERDNLEEIIKTEEKRRDLQDQLTEKAGGMLDKLESQVKNIPIVGDLLASTMDFGGLKEQLGGVMKGITQNFVSLSKSGVPVGKAIGMSFKGAIPGIASFGAALWAALYPILPIIIGVVAAIALFKRALELDQQVADLSREMGIANDEAREMINSFNGMSVSSGNLNMSTKNLIEAQKQLASSIGMTAQYSAGMLQDQIMLTKYMGMSGEQAAQFQKIAASSGMSTREMQEEVAGTVTQLNEATGLSVDFAGVMRDISDLSPTIRSHFKGNVKEMALAVAQAKALGTTLQESSDAAQNLLNMESSLQAEMKARVLTGVNINNDEIRRAQLAGKHEEVLRLQAKQMQEIGDVSKMTDMQQRAIADAMGMSVDQLLKMNEQQTMLKKLGVDNLADLKKEDILRSNLTKEEKEKLLTQREQASAQEKMNALTGKLSAMWDQIAMVLVPIITYLVDLLVPTIQYALDQVQGIFNVFKGIAMILTGDFQEGLKLLGDGLVQWVLAPFKWIYNTFKAVFGGGDEGGYDESVAESGESIDDGVIKPDGSVVKTNPADFIMATKSPSDLMSSVLDTASSFLDPFGMIGGAADMVGGLFGGGSGESTTIDYDKLAEAISNQPLQVVIDGKVINTITRKQSMNKSFNKQMG